MKLRYIFAVMMVGLFLSSISLTMADHNDEFPTNDCDTADHSISITTRGEDLVFIIGGEENPDVEVASGSCVEVTFENSSTLDHDFTVVDDTVDPEEELIHMDTPPGDTTNHFWRMPERDVSLKYFCEVEGHRESGMEGNFIIGEGSGGLPGFEAPLAFAGLMLLAMAIPLLRRRN